MSACGAVKPDLVMLSSCLQGQTGPQAMAPGYGMLMAAQSGFYYLSGYPDGDLAPPYGAYTDYHHTQVRALRCCWRRSITAGALDRDNTSTSRSTKRRCIFWPPPCWTISPTDGCWSVAATAATVMLRMAPIDAATKRAPNAGSRLRSATTAHWQGLMNVLGNPALR